MNIYKMKIFLQSISLLIAFSGTASATNAATENGGSFTSGAKCDGTIIYNLLTSSVTD